MSKPSQYLLISLPSSIVPSHHRDDALEAVSVTVSPDNGSVASFPIPEFKIGTLDALVQQADELAKLEGQCQAVVGKVGDALKNILEGDEAQIERMKVVNDKPVDQYLRTFQWNKVKYRADKSLAELIDLLQKEGASIDNDIRFKYSQYNQVKNTLATLQRKQTSGFPPHLPQAQLTAYRGNLSTKSLASIIDPRSIVQDSEFIETHLVAVPSQQVKDFLKTYETITAMKHSVEFVHKAREQKWIPRDFKYVEGGKEEEAKEVERVGGDERKLWGRRCVLAPTTKQADRAKKNLEDKYSYLAGNAFGRDKKGRVKRDDPNEMHGAESNAEYTPYVFYEFEFN
ncbi:ATPase V1 complex subunit C [Penicillium atrosanguineum]|nr:ATPase V1 complex subunit C [Penicillium atrosanguineum]